ncbi:TRAP transporter small permease [Reinekea thalattae]|uniref:TRAP transporter small permease protein n=1 Tax=Reinekea thalattae TaxID=2593301 RepID=A0A5C8Z892_9GAMM|nr:TRAP transporter small permease [Reinekea thalattae]TXR53371.1 TRAP transporter small permease [Reinekea thalattae]
MLQKVSKALDQIEGFLIATILASASVLTFVQVFFRYVLNDSIFWAEEAVLYLIIAMSFLSTSLGVRKKSHITVDVLKACIPKSFQAVFLFISSLIGFVFGLLIFYYGYALYSSAVSRGQLTPTLRMPIAYIYALIPITACLQSFRYFESMVSLVFKPKQPDKTDS